MRALRQNARMHSPAEVFGAPRAVVGMVHLPALPGAPQARAGMEEIIAQACAEADIYAGAGVHALLIENMHDRPYLRGRVGPEIVAAMTAAACAVRARFPGPVGVQVLAGANEEALAVALAAGLDFVRAEGFVFAHVADEGIIEGCAGPLLRARRAWGAERVRVFTDIKKKHSSHAITSDVSLAETARAAEFFSSDGLVISGASTGDPVDPAELEEVSGVARLPLLIGSGVTGDNVEDMFRHAGAVIVGSHFKRDGHWASPLDAERVRRFMGFVEQAGR